MGTRSVLLATSENSPTYKIYNNSMLISDPMRSIRVFNLSPSTVRLLLDYSAYINRKICWSLLLSFLVLALGGLNNQFVSLFGISFQVFNLSNQDSITSRTRSRPRRAVRIWSHFPHTGYILLDSRGSSVYPRYWDSHRLK